MDLKELEKKWQKDLPKEADGLVNKRKKGNRWNRIMKSAKARKKLKEKS